ncbi:hypothetical protein CODIS_22860 [Candidatus Thiodiazotropha endolucinida]|uniref:Uncharacterized protein n=1 Tax=Candidatus Thiodiazotropha endolucinida TaxID=1655433 RepID=A0A7Z0VLZ3_9GAMM|nr:hypothetical protein CODIS_22860 [Candidatus Thiodiazotropha endolucinida]
MVVAVVTVGVMEPTIDDVVGVVAVWNSLMSTARSVDVSVFMFDRLALVWIFFIDFKAMFIIVVAMFVVHVTIMQVVGVVAMFNLGVTAVFTVLMIVVFMCFTFFDSHDPLLLLFTIQYEYSSLKQFLRNFPCNSCHQLQ